MSDFQAPKTLKDVLYDKTHTCPVCDKDFISKAIRIGKNQVISIDSDLYAHYSIVNPILYDILFCPHCGYAALSKSFDSLLPKQKEWIRTQICSNFKPHASYEYITIEEGIYRHKMALLNCITKKGKVGEQAYLALHTAWLYRDLKNETAERVFLQRAYEGLIEALETERFPLFGLDEITTMYIVSDLAYRLDQLSEAKKYLSIVLTTPGASDRIKDRAHELKDKLSL